MSAVRKLGIFFGLFFFLLLWVPFDKTNPTVSSPILLDKNLESILRKSCYDCHSFETNWPWYSHVFPISYFVHNHVREGREELNFSEWESLKESAKLRKWNTIWEEIEEDNMPPKSYRLLHADSILTEEEKEILKKYIQSQTGEEE